MTMDDGTDPVLAARARIDLWVRRGLRAGYGLFGLAMVLFFLALWLGFSSVLSGLITFCLFAGSAILAPSIVLNYAVKAANRADRDGTW